MKKQEEKKREWLQLGHGEYSELSNETEFFDACKKSVHVVVHFYRQETMRCAIVDKHLQILAVKHPETRFLKISVDKAPFLCDRMKIRVLPTIVLFKDFKSVDYIIGFDSLGGHDEFTTEMMEWRIAQKGLFVQETILIFYSVYSRVMFALEVHSFIRFRTGLSVESRETFSLKHKYP